MRLTSLVLIMSSVALAADPESRARDVVADLAARAFERVAKRFDPTMAGALPAEKLAPVWDGLLAQAGAFKAIREVKLEKKQAYDVAQVRAQFEKAEVIITIAMNAEGQVSGLFFKPASPAAAWAPPPYARAELVDLPVTVGPKFKLPGSLLLPTGAGPFPAVIFVHGSGPNDRDETVGPNKLFKDLALGLGAKGIATLRYDKRTLVAPAEFKPTTPYTVKDEVLDDVREAVSLLAANPKIDPKRIYVAGHSLGASLAPRVAAEDARVAGIVIMAGYTRQLDVIVREQVKLTSPGNAELAASVEAFSKRWNDPKLAAGEVIDFLGAKLPGAYFLDLRAYDPAKTAAALKVPLLVVQGERDYQVTMGDYDGWKKALAGKPNATLKSYPALNHQFLEGKGPSTPAEYQTPGHAPLELVGDLAAWVSKPPASK
jgi:hypothetical protein